MLLLLLILSCKASSQNRIQIDLVDSVKDQFREVTIRGTDTLIVTKKDSIKAYLITSYFLNNYINLIGLYRKKDSVQFMFRNSIADSYSRLLEEYKNLSDSIRNNIEKSNGIILGVQNDISSSRNALSSAVINIKDAQLDIVKSNAIVTEAQNKIQSAINDLQRVKKRNDAWKYTAVGVGAFLIGFLISR
jgi:hypothetical protein